MNTDTTKIHRVCCWTFHGPDPSVPDTEYTVDHKDGKRRNNSADNLYWATWEEQHANIGIGRFEEGVPRVLRRKPDNPKMERNLPPRYLPAKKTHIQCYEYFTLDGMTREQI